MKRITQIKVLVGAVLALLTVIVLVQNRQPAQTKLLFVTIEMPRAIMLLGTLAIGFAAGLVTAGIWARKK